MDYSEDELNYIASKKPEYKLEPVPSLDFVIVKFLEKYEVYVRPASSSKRTARDVGSSAIAGAIGGIAGADVAGDAFIIKGQEKQTAVQEWTQWKQWALDHKDFEAFRAEHIDKAKAKNEVVLNKLNNSEIKKEIDLLLKKRPFHISTEQKNTGGIIYTTIALSVLVVGLAWIPIQDFIQNRDSNSYSFLYQEHIEE